MSARRVNFILTLAIGNGYIDHPQDFPCSCALFFSFYPAPSKATTRIQPTTSRDPCVTPPMVPVRDSVSTHP